MSRQEKWDRIEIKLADRAAKAAVKHSHDQFHQEKYFMSCYWCIFETLLDSDDELGNQLLQADKAAIDEENKKG